MSSENSDTVGMRLQAISQLPSEQDDDERQMDHSEKVVGYIFVANDKPLEIL
jgi:hypothetical protein